jgi:DNA polymerase-1
MSLVPATPEAYKLLHDGAIALSRVEDAGIRIDVEYLDNTIKEVSDKINEIKARIYDTDVWYRWRRKFGERANISARQQLAAIFFGELGYAPTKRTRTGNVAADEEVLVHIDHPFCRAYTRLQKLEKLHGTYLLGVRREVQGDLLHPSYNLHTVITYRGSCSDPNFQNIPIRDPVMGRYIRQAFIPREPGWRLVESDFKGIEVCVAACYHKDPTMLRYIRDGYDMHRDMAAECYLLPRDKVPKACRQQAKALFVFAQFYGDYYVSCAKSLWEAVVRHKLATADDVDIHEHLATNGILKLGACDPKQSPTSGTFEKHIHEVEQRFWGERFPVYDRWRRDWYKAYLKEGGFSTHTGFRVEGVYTRNFVINCPVQGSAFHCLLWVLIRLVRELRRRGMRSMVVGQIHDSIIADIHPDEFDEYIALVRHLIEEALPAAYPWIITPMQAEMEACPVGGTWYDKQPVEMVA